MKPFQKFGALVAAAVCLITSNTAQAELIYGLEANNTLFAFDSANTSITTTVGVLSGIPAGHSIIGIDLRPATNELIAISFDPVTLGGNVLTINKDTAALTVIGSGFALASGPTNSKNNNWGVDFNPTVDRIRVVNGDDQNLRLNPLTGGSSGIDTTISSTQNVELVGIAYDRNDTDLATLTTLFAYDFKNDLLGRIGGVNGTPSPNGGIFTSIGPSGITAGTSDLDLDISGATGTGYAVVRTDFGSRSSFYTFSTATGAFTRVGDFLNRTVSDLAVSPGIYVPPVVFYQVSLKAKPARFGTVTGLGNFAAGSEVILRAKPKKGREFIGWFEKDKRISKKKKLIISSLNANRSFAAKFK
jgi:Domain of unknown function (DUF4394)/Divergent InlB B-repeat domain